MTHAADALAYGLIHNLYSRYANAIDEGRGADFAAVFAPGAGFSPNTGPFQEDRGRFSGSDAIAGFVTSTQANRPRHLMLNIEVEQLTATTGKTRALFALLDTTNGQISGIGEYRDEVVLVDAEGEGRDWRFAEKRVSFVWQSDALRARADSAPRAS